MLGRMREWLVLVCVVACGGGSDGDDGLAPPSCPADGTFRYIHDIGGTTVEGEIPDVNYAFGNKISDDPGSLDIGQRGTPGGDRVHLEFDQAILDGQTVRARGLVQIGSLDVGNCETGSSASKFTALRGEDGGWTFVFVDLHEAPYCEGAAVTGSFAGCLTGKPF